MAALTEVYVRGSSADPAVTAQHSLRTRSEDLLAEVAAKVAVATELRVSLVDREAAQQRLVQFCTDHLLPHLEVTDRALYAVAADHADTRLLVQALRCQHRAITEHVAALDRAENLDAETAAAHALVAVLQGCAEIERYVLVPAVAALPGVNLSAAVEDLALRTAGAALDVPEVLDVREIPPGQRHPTIFGVYSRLGVHESFVLLNNHDPVPLRRQFEATYPRQFSWDYLESGPTRWRVRITRHTVT